MTRSANALSSAAVSLSRGLYARVARDLAVDPSYVSRVARGERESEAVEKALSRELHKILADMKNGMGRSGKKRNKNKNRVER